MKNPLTIRDVIEILKTFDQDLPVATYGGDENYHFLTDALDFEVEDFGRSNPPIDYEATHYVGSFLKL